MIKIELKNNRGYAWTHHNKVYCKGYAFVNDEVVENEALAQYFDSLPKDDVLSQAKSLNGFFAVVVEYETSVLAFTDHVRSFPLFYYKSDEDLILCDGFPEERIKTLSLNKAAEKQLGGALYLLWNQTLFEGVRGIEAGAFLWVTQDGDLQYDFYYNFAYDDVQITDIDEALEKMNKAYEASFKRLIKYLNGRTAVVPLSGGHDSRLLAYYLVKLGYTNIIAFSYGDPKMTDSIISKQAAAALGIKYYYIPYERKNLRKAFRKHYKEYMIYAANGVSTPGLQTWYAVHWLKEHKIIDENCVFCPGYGGVLPGHYINSSYMTQEFIEKENLIKQFEIEYFARLSRAEPEYYVEFMKCFENAKDIFELPQKVHARRAAEIFEQWIYREDQTKGIQNATRMYEFYGVKWATPFFEKSQFDLWASIDNSLRYQNKAFKKMEEGLFEGEIATVPFTGSKEMVVRSKKRNFLQKCIHISDICLRPRKHHYMNVIVPIFTHIYNTLVKKISSPNYYTLCQYLKYVRRYINTKNEKTD